VTVVERTAMMAQTALQHVSAYADQHPLPTVAGVILGALTFGTLAISAIPDRNPRRAYGLRAEIDALNREARALREEFSSETAEFEADKKSTIEVVGRPETGKTAELIRAYNRALAHGVTHSDIMARLSADDAWISAAEMKGETRIGVILPPRTMAEAQTICGENSAAIEEMNAGRASVGMPPLGVVTEFAFNGDDVEFTIKPGPKMFEFASCRRCAQIG
jgi:hypothetical protein